MDLAPDLRHGLNRLRRDLPFTTVTMLTLCVGVGVLTALFAVTNAVLLQPVATDQDRVVRIWKDDLERGLERHPFSYPEFLDTRDNTRSCLASWVAGAERGAADRSRRDRFPRRRLLRGCSGRAGDRARNGAGLAVPAPGIPV